MGTTPLRYISWVLTLLLHPSMLFVWVVMVAPNLDLLILMQIYKFTTSIFARKREWFRKIPIHTIALLHFGRHVFLKWPTPLQSQVQQFRNDHHCLAFGTSFSESNAPTTLTASRFLCFHLCFRLIFFSHSTTARLSSYPPNPGWDLALASYAKIHLNPSLGYQHGCSSVSGHELVPTFPGIR